MTLFTDPCCNILCILLSVIANLSAVFTEIIDFQVKAIQGT